MKTLFALLVTTMAISAPLSVAAQDGRRVLDRVEDRLDRIESRRDERVDLGRRDVIEDRIDRWESRRDEAGKDSPKFINRWERRSWRKRWHSVRNE